MGRSITLDGWPVDAPEAAEEREDNYKAWYERVKATATVKETPERAEHKDAGKPQISLVPPEAIIAIARVMMAGITERGYEPNNWRKGMPVVKLLDSAMRHILAHNMGIVMDDGPQGTGCPHIDCAATNLSMAIALIATGKGT